MFFLVSFFVLCLLVFSIFFFFVSFFFCVDCFYSILGMLFFYFWEDSLMICLFSLVLFSVLVVLVMLSKVFLKMDLS